MNKVLQDIGLAKRAGKIILGFDVVKESIIKKQAKLVIVASDISPKTLKEITFLNEKYQSKMIQSNITIDELWQMLGKRVGIISIIDENFSKKTLEHFNKQ